MGQWRSALLAGTLGLAAVGGASPPAPSEEEASLRAVDARQRQVVLAGDVGAMRALAHPNLRINAPDNRVLTGAQLLAAMGSGEIAAERFERVPEVVTLSGSIGVVMGHETFVPVATSALGRLYGARELRRRYTNVYLREAGAWRLLARHANVIPDAAPR